jgi:site-specific DNA recombinase
MKTAAIYARVSSDKQKEENTIASQTSALIAFAREQNCDVPTEWVIEDDGYSGASLLRPGLERVRDLAAEGRIQAVIVYAPDRLSRRYAHQILLIEEFARAGVEVLFIRSRRATTPEDELLLQFQGMIAGTRANPGAVAAREAPSRPSSATPSPSHTPLREERRPAPSTVP